MNATTPPRSLASTLAVASGAVFLLVGILGFVPGVTQEFDALGGAGHHSEAMLLGIFQVSVLHNIVHLAFGVIGLAVATRTDWSITYLIASGVIYGVLSIYGFVIDMQSEANFVPVNMADNWLHVILTIALLGGGLVASRQRRDRDRTVRP
ncbi:DUF4383 domain-containing protein [Aeromicrobium camelliae]|uniref:DUF4383 domain-containing protein n=1 Tax=Aeromicrobium camelliae TaxID=1538144 RepID=A0A3N6ZSJ2_9ACTN|nr:DUF4383 domain-containing protein [Aeromicrobium camelliae]